MAAEYQRKLPPYEKLRDLYISGKSYAEIAKIYGCQKDVVGRTLRRRAEARGELSIIIATSKRRDKVRIRNSNAGRFINGVAIFEMAEDYRIETKLTATEFCEKAGINKSTWYVWRRKHDQKRHLYMDRRAARKVLEFMGEVVPSWL